MSSIVLQKIDVDVLVQLAVIGPMEAVALGAPRRRARRSRRPIVGGELRLGRVGRSKG